MRTARRSDRKPTPGPRRRLVAPLALMLFLACVGAYMLISPRKGPIEPAGARTIATTPPVLFEPAFVDFGELPMNVTRTASTHMVNTGSVPLRIVTGRSSCACTRVDVAPVMVQPGAGIPITITMDSLAKAGVRRYTASIIVEGYEEPAEFLVSRTVLEE